jgi:hypothetical protein
LLDSLLASLLLCVFAWFRVCLFVCFFVSVFAR